MGVGDIFLKKKFAISRFVTSPLENSVPSKASSLEIVQNCVIPLDNEIEFFVVVFLIASENFTDFLLTSGNSPHKKLTDV